MVKLDQNERGTKAVSETYGEIVRYERDERGRRVWSFWPSRCWSSKQRLL